MDGISPNPFLIGLDVDAFRDAFKDVVELPKFELRKLEKSFTGEAGLNDFDGATSVFTCSDFNILV